MRIGSRAPAGAGEWVLTLRGGEVALGETPIVVPLAAGIPPGMYHLVPGNGGDLAIAQVFVQGDRPFLAAIFPRVSAAKEAVYALTPLPSSQSEPAFGLSVRTGGQNLAVELGRQLLTEYRIAEGNKPFFFPLVGPTGVSYTRAYPMLAVDGEDHDHPHQRSCWFTHGKVNGIDFWSEGKNTGTIRELERKLVAAGPLVVRLETRDEWLGPDKKRICSDERTVTIYATKKTRVFDFAFTIRATDGPVELGDTKEGMFGLRVASSMDAAKKTGGKITSADGLTDEKAWGRAARWVDYSGPIDGKPAGIAILNHPKSFRYPTTWHVRPYGLFAANPFGWHDFGMTERGDFTMQGGGSIAFYYRVILHDGDTDSAALPEQFEAYARPPVIELKMN